MVRSDKKVTGGSVDPGAGKAERGRQIYAGGDGQLTRFPAGGRWRTRQYAMARPGELGGRGPGGGRLGDRSAGLGGFQD